jgi:amino acid permease
MSNFDFVKKVSKNGYFINSLIQVLFLSYTGPILSYTGPICLIQVLFFSDFSRFFPTFPNFSRFFPIFPFFAYAVSWLFTKRDNTVCAKKNEKQCIKKIMTF